MQKKYGAMSMFSSFFSPFLPSSAQEQSPFPQASSMNCSAHSLPTGWCAFTDDNTQRTYYAHVSGIVQWDPPPTNPPPPPALPPPPSPPPARWDGTTNFYLGAGPPAVNQKHRDGSFGYRYHNYQQQLSRKRDYDQVQLCNHNYYDAYSYVKRGCYGYQPTSQLEVFSKRCSRCNEEIMYKDYAKRQWIKEGGERKCKNCVKMFLAENKFTFEPAPGMTNEDFWMANADSNKGNNVAVENDDVASKTVSMENEECSHFPCVVSARGGPSTVGIKPGGIPNMRRCSKCHRYRDHNHFSKTQWLLPHMFRRCKRCMDDDAEAVKAAQRTQDINDRRFMYGDTSKPRECISCKLELEWDKFSVRQWTAVECARRCRECVDKSLAEFSAAKRVGGWPKV
jgi:hypothetical protein